MGIRPVQCCVDGDIRRSRGARAVPGRGCISVLRILSIGIANGTSGDVERKKSGDGNMSTAGRNDDVEWRWIDDRCKSGRSGYRRRTQTWSDGCVVYTADDEEQCGARKNEPGGWSH